MKIIIIDDEANARKVLRTLITKINQKYTIVKEFALIQDAIEAIETIDFDIILLDIEMLDGQGFDLIKTFPRLSNRVIFTTAYEQYALQAIKAHAADYILKPIDIDELKVSIESIYLKLLMENKASVSTKSPRKISIKSAHKVDLISEEDITCCLAEGAYSTIHTFDGHKITASKSLLHFENSLSSNFFRSSKSSLININQVKSYTRSSDGCKVHLNCGQIIDVSRRRKILFLAEINKHEL